ncbi:type VII secretion-associated protein [Rhodococcus sp. OK302]|uniref:type VII secretion-associated protein n=1 Tax=Rhodococcus sp. OK302 TaxID=1882769 RepID=UPI000B9F0A32|nr:type VII secretion-associated protein [Rhodococcus sp. OK302]OYD68996.1 type VII secretion-associated protein (TIGR03931 family) [Rhodococcus sp. OK302]
MRPGANATAVIPGATLSVSVHIGTSNAWSATAQREFCCRADIEGDSRDHSRFGGVNPLDYIDDDYIEFGGRITSTVLELVTLISHAVQGCGLSDADVLYLSYPSEWGHARKGRLLVAARQVGHDVVLVPSAIAVARSMRSVWRSRCIVVEIRSGDAVVSCLRDFDGDVTVMSTRRGRLAELPDLFAEFDELTGRDTVVVVGRQSHSVASSLERGSRSIHGYASVRVLDESRIVRSIVDPRVRLDAVTAENSAGRAVDNSAFGDRWVPPSHIVGPTHPTRRSRRWWPVVTACAVVICALAAGVVIVSGRGGTEDANTAGGIEGTVVHGLTADASPVDSPATTSTLSRTSDALPTTTTVPLELGRVRLDLPAGWSREPGRSTTGRTDIVPPSGTDRKIVIVEKELREGVEFDEVEGALRAQFTTLEDPSRFQDFESVVTVEGRKTVLYMEFPDGYSEVRWKVYVERGLQVSIGCQYLVGEWDMFESECGRVTGSLTYVN